MLHCKYVTHLQGLNVHANRVNPDNNLQKEKANQLTHARGERLAGCRWLTLHFILKVLLCFIVSSISERRK
jgi:hypothetical protein